MVLHLALLGYALYFQMTGGGGDYLETWGNQIVSQLVGTTSSKSQRSYHLKAETSEARTGKIDARRKILRTPPVNDPAIWDGPLDPVTGLPLEWHVRDYWPYLEERGETSLPYLPDGEKEDLQAWAAAAMAVINMRGAAWHGRTPTRFYSMDDMYKWGGETQEPSAVFDKHFGGHRVLDDVTQIKEELMANGPVAASYLRKSSERNGVLLGWERVRGGKEVWILRESWGRGSGKKTKKIKVGSRGIEDNVVAPEMSMSEKRWQRGRVWEKDFNGFLPHDLEKKGKNWEELDEFLYNCSGLELERNLQRLKIGKKGKVLIKL